MKELATTMRGVESVRGGRDDLVPQKVNGRTRLLPADPHKASKVLREHRGVAKKATKVAARMKAAMRARGIIFG